MVPLSLHSYELLCVLNCVKYLATGLVQRDIPLRASITVIKTFKALTDILKATIYAKELEGKCAENNLNFIL